MTPPSSTTPSSTTPSSTPPTPTPPPFDLTAPLPVGTTVLEASAGTGKTFAIVGVAARCIAEGAPIATMLLVTFSRSATAELRERMRERVHELVIALADPAAAATSADDVTRYLATGAAGEIATRRAHLVRALSDFDSSTIATTHTFCSRMLEALGFLGERDIVHQILEDADDLVEQIARDVYLAGYRTADDPPVTFPAALTIAREAVRQQGVDLSPEASDLDGSGSDGDVTAARHRVRFAARVREIVAERKRTARIRTYDDLQMILYRIVTDDVVGEEACQRIRASFDLVLIDEFQDTDPFQWAIVRLCFHGHRTLVLVGDPKQSIYGFRGAEVLSYLQAVGAADARRVLPTNWRSEGDLVAGLASIYGGAALGDPRIVAHPVRAAKPGTSLSGSTPVRIRAFQRSSFTTTGQSGYPPVADIRKEVVADVASDIAGLLSSGTTFEASGRRRRVHPGDIAILVKRNSTIGPLQEALASVGVASVIGSGTSVFHTPAARDWLAVVAAVEQPARAERVRLAALTPLIGWTAEQLDRDGDRGVAGLAATLHDLGRVFDEAGFAAMSQRLMARHDVAERLLSEEGGERHLTDLIQIVALCNARVMATGAGLAAIGEWLADRVADSGRSGADDQTRRLDRDTQVVQIMTVHASKGLEFPIVYVPFGWDASRPRDRETFAFHDREGNRRLDVGGARAPGAVQRTRQADEEVAGEDLRLLYVALTRARVQVVMWWAPSFDAPIAAAHRILFGRVPGSPTVPLSVPVPDDDTCVATLRAVGERSSAISVEKAGAASGRRWVPDTDAVDAPELSVAHFDREVDQGWRRTSYSAIVADAGHSTIRIEPSGGGPVVASGSEPDTGLLDDEPAEYDGDIDDGRSDDDDRIGTPSLMNGLPFGAAFGTLVHEVLEHVDTDMPDITDHVADLCRAAMRFGSPDIDVDTLTRALVGVLTTPLSFGDLWSIPTRNRLAEMEFEFPLASHGGAAPTPTSIADLLDEHLDDADPLRAYPDRLRDLPERALRGFLTGSIDSVLRTADDRYVVVDYKTNRLRPGVLVVEDFTREAMAEEMIAAHYPLQALIYSVALHRYLRWRIPDYSPDRHLGPVQYHFVRGMAGPETPAGCGVMEWPIPPVLIAALSDLLAGSRSGGAR